MLRQLRAVLKFPSQGKTDASSTYRLTDACHGRAPRFDLAKVRQEVQRDPARRRRSPRVPEPANRHRSRGASFHEQCTQRRSGDPVRGLRDLPPSRQLPSACGVGHRHRSGPAAEGDVFNAEIDQFRQPFGRREGRLPEVLDPGKLTLRHANLSGQRSQGHASGGARPVKGAVRRGAGLGLGTLHTVLVSNTLSEIKRSCIWCCRFLSA